MPERNQNEASPAALQVIAKHHRKILFSLGEKEIRRAQNEKSKEHFSVVRRALGSDGGAASFVGFRLVESSDFVQEGQIPTKNSGYRSFLLESAGHGLEPGFPRLPHKTRGLGIEPRFHGPEPCCLPLADPRVLCGIGAARRDYQLHYPAKR